MNPKPTFAEAWARRFATLKHRDTPGGPAVSTPRPQPLTVKERKELDRLHAKWATMRASWAEIRRAQELERRLRAYQEAARGR